MLIPSSGEIVDGVLGFGQKLNGIKAITESTCEDKWSIMAETALPAAGEAMYLLLVPDPTQILQNYLRPSPTRGGSKGLHRRHGGYREGRTGRRRWWRTLQFPDTDEAIANILPGNDLFKGRQVGLLERWIWTGIDVLDRVGWYWLLIDATNTFVTAWESGIIESRFCTSPYNAQFSAEPTRDFLDQGGGVWMNAEDANVTVNNGWQVFSNGRIHYPHSQLPSGIIDLHITGVGTGEAGHSGGRAAELIIDGDYFIGEFIQVKPGEKVEMHVTAESQGVKDVAFRVASGGGNPDVGIANMQSSCVALLDKDI